MKNRNTGEGKVFFLYSNIYKKEISFHDFKKFNEITKICEGTNIMNSWEHYMNRRRNTGDLHGQAPLLWCSSALMKK
jgi:hypothetical protein